MSTYSRNHDTGTFISTEFPRREAVLHEHVRGPPRGGAPAEGPRPGGPRREQRVSDVRARHCAPLELLQVAQVVLIKEPDVRRARAKHGEPFNSASESETLIASRVVPDASQDVGMDHPAAGRLDPAVPAADVALGIAALAGEAVERDLGRRLGEREIVHAEADLSVAAEYLPRERVEDALEIGHGELLVDRQALVLEEDRLPDRVGRLVAVAAARDDDANRRLALLHHPHLHRRRVRSAEDGTRRIVAERIRDPQGVPLLASGVARWAVERFEVVVIPLDLGTLD